MGTTVALLRTGHIEKFLHAGTLTTSTRPWTLTEIDAYTSAVLAELWPDVGVYTTGDVTSDSTVMEYTIPGSIERITIIDILDSSDYYIDRVMSWRPLPSGKVLIKPRITDNLTLRFTGYKPYAADATDIPVRLEQIVAFRSLARAYDGLAGELINSERQQNLDSGRVISYQEAAQQATFYEGKYRDAIIRDPSLIRSGPRASHR
ncbi:MAG: hypothetical protein DRH30_00490 [Deltaproteobacteria bacterium]|nr:MAG: hypothetical protein DRH30_00490 [Deltaproteobacteria bacterium]